MTGTQKVQNFANPTLPERRSRPRAWQAGSFTPTEFWL